MTFSADDYARAVSLICHAAAGDATGIKLMIEETGPRGAQLFTAMCDAYAHLVDEYCDTDTTKQVLVAQIGALAARGRTPHHRRAAAAVFAYATACETGNPKPFNRLLADAQAEGHATDLTAALCDVYNTVLPVLGTESVRDELHRWIARLLDYDHGEP